MQSGSTVYKLKIDRSSSVAFPSTAPLVRSRNQLQNTKLPSHSAAMPLWKQSLLIIYLRLLRFVPWSTNVQLKPNKIHMQIKHNKEIKVASAHNYLTHKKKLVKVHSELRNRHHTYYTVRLTRSSVTLSRTYYLCTSMVASALSSTIDCTVELYNLWVKGLGFRSIFTTCYE